MIERLETRSFVTVTVGRGAGIACVSAVAGEQAELAVAGCDSKAGTAIVHDAATITVTPKLVDWLAANAGSTTPQEAIDIVIMIAKPRIGIALKLP